MSSVIHRVVAEARFFGNTILEAALHPMSTSVVDKTSGAVVSRISSKDFPVSGSPRSGLGQAQTSEDNTVDDSQEQQVTDVEAELNETRQAIRVMLDFLEKDVDLTEASKKVSLPELF
ncbi:MAG: hypothetical protein O2913_10825 [Chloroflexi bacterium]|nr:hypothetical protein [Chloroflexota bacterium]